MTFYDAFCGVGGFRLGLEAAGYRCVGSCEIDKNACDTYEAHFGERPQGDITKIPSKDIPDHDIFTAGFPCQAFSVAGARKGFKDPRGAVFFETIRIIKDKKPSFFILENVRGLLSIQHGEIFKFMMHELYNLGYGVDYRVLRTSDYTDAPQKRDRVYIIGKRGEDAIWRFKWPPKKPTHRRALDVMHETHGEKVDKKYFIPKKSIEERIKRKIEWQKKHDPKNVGRIDNRGHVMRLLGVDDLAPTITCNINDSIAVQTKLKNVGDLSGKNQQGYRVYDARGLSCSLNARGGGWGANTGLYYFLDPKDLSRTVQVGGQGSKSFKHNWQVYKAPSGVRRLTPRECARLQGFPDTFKLPTVDKQGYEQMGNAVSVPVITLLGNRL